MRDPSRPSLSGPRHSFLLVIAILAMIVVPAGLTLHTVHLSALNPTTATTPGASPYGYTVLLHLHPESIALAVVLVAGAIIYKKFFSPTPEGFPGYFIFIALTALAPASALLPSARPVINWRAFSLAIFFVLLVSIIWEATLA